MGNNITHLLAITTLNQSFTATEMLTARNNIGVNASLFSSVDGALAFTDADTRLNILSTLYNLSVTAPLSLSVANGKLTVTHNNKYSESTAESGYKVGCDSNGHAILSKLVFSDLSNTVDAQNHAHYALTYNGLLHTDSISPAVSASTEANFTTALLALSDGDRYLRPSSNVAYNTSASSTDYTNWAKYNFISKKQGNKGTVLFGHPNKSTSGFALSGITPPVISLKPGKNMGFNSSTGTLISTYAHPVYTAYPLGLYKFKVADGHIASATLATKDDFMTSAFGFIDKDTTYTFATGPTDKNGTFTITPSDGSAITLTPKGLASAAYKQSGFSDGNIPTLAASLTTNIAVMRSSGGLTSFDASKNWNDSDSAAFYSLGNSFKIDSNGIISVKVAEPLSWNGHLDLSVNTNTTGIALHSNGTRKTHGSASNPAFMYPPSTRSYCSAYISELTSNMLSLNCGFATSSGGISYSSATADNMLISTEVRPSSTEKRVYFTATHTGIYRIDVHIPTLYAPQYDNTSYIHLCMYVDTASSSSTVSWLDGGRPREPSETSPYQQATSVEMTAGTIMDSMKSTHQVFYVKGRTGEHININFAWKYHSNKNNIWDQMKKDESLVPDEYASGSDWFFNNEVTTFDYLYGIVTYAFIGPE